MVPATLVSSSNQVQKNYINIPNVDTQQQHDSRSQLVMQWTLDENSKLICQWVKVQD